jgi:hypothetical protein
MVREGEKGVASGFRAEPRWGEAQEAWRASPTDTAAGEEGLEEGGLGGEGREGAISVRKALNLVVVGLSPHGGRVSQ